MRDYPLAVWILVVNHFEFPAEVTQIKINLTIESTLAPDNLQISKSKFNTSNYQEGKVYITLSFNGKPVHLKITRS